VTLPLGLVEAPRQRRTAHVAFVHGWLGCELVEANYPERAHWGDNPITCLRALTAESALLSQVTVPRAWIPGGLTKNYRDFVSALKLHNFFRATENNLTVYTYDWRLGLAEASSGLNAHLDGAPENTTIVAHSYGALVSIFAIASGSVRERNLRKLNRMILLAPPYYGSTFALLGLAKSADFLRLAGEFLPALAKTLFAVFSAAPDLITRQLVPVLGSFQSLYDMVPHDVDTEDLRILSLPLSRQTGTSARWPFWEAYENALQRRKEALRVQRVLREYVPTMEIASIFSSTDEDTPHYCKVGPSAPFALLHAKGVDGDGVVAKCCTYPAGEPLRCEIDWSDPYQLPAGHSALLRHRTTHEFLASLLA
jgi:hypothetical protein